MTPAATLDLEGLPPLTWNDGWTARDVLPSWAGFRAGDHRAVPAGSEPGAVPVWLQASDPSTAPGRAALAAYRDLRRNEAAITEAVVAAIAKTTGVHAPPPEAAADLRRHIALRSVFVHDVDCVGLGYVGFELACTWDPEHGIGVMMHGTRVVDVGGADTAILSWIARRDRDGVPIHEHAQR